MKANEHKCGWECLYLSVTKIQTIKNYEGRDIDVCPCCVDHPQGDPGEFLDCKNVFQSGGQSVGQCMCYSPVHGKREKAFYDDMRK